MGILGNKGNAFPSDIVLGEEYHDKQSGVIGIATSIHFYQHACERVTLELRKSDGDLLELTFDAPRLTNTKTQQTATTTKTGGPERASGQRGIPTR